MLVGIRDIKSPHKLSHVITNSSLRQTYTLLDLHLVSVESSGPSNLLSIWLELAGGTTGAVPLEQHWLQPHGHKAGSGRKIQEINFPDTGDAGWAFTAAWGLWLRAGFPEMEPVWKQDLWLKLVGWENVCCVPVGEVVLPGEAELDVSTRGVFNGSASQPVPGVYEEGQWRTGHSFPVAVVWGWTSAGEASIKSSILCPVSSSVETLHSLQQVLEG